MKIATRVITLITIFIICSWSSSIYAAQDKWSGQYVFSKYSGRTRGGDAMVYGMVLNINGQDCTIHEDGFQVMTRIACSVSSTRSGVDIKFKKYLPDNFLSESFKGGEVLFSLEKENGGAIKTIWKALEPDVSSKTGIYLRKVK